MQASTVAVGSGGDGDRGSGGGGDDGTANSPAVAHQPPVEKTLAKKRSAGAMRPRLTPVPVSSLSWVHTPPSSRSIDSSATAAASIDGTDWSDILADSHSETSQNPMHVGADMEDEADSRRRPYPSRRSSILFLMDTRRIMKEKVSEKASFIAHMMDELAESELRLATASMRTKTIRRCATIAIFCSAAAVFFVILVLGQGAKQEYLSLNDETGSWLQQSKCEEVERPVTTTFTTNINGKSSAQLPYDSTIAVLQHSLTALTMTEHIYMGNIRAAKESFESLLCTDTHPNPKSNYTNIADYLTALYSWVYAEQNMTITTTLEIGHIWSPQVTSFGFQVAHGLKVRIDAPESISHVASHRIASHRIASHRIASHRIASHRIASHRIASHRTIPYHAAPRAVRVISHTSNKLRTRFQIGFRTPLALPPRYLRFR